jgi:hypothetical protein
MSLVQSLSHRGLSIPREEIEPLFSAPVARADIVRYRLLANALRTLVAALFVGSAAVRVASNPLFAFCGVFLGLATLGSLQQLLAIAAGAIERKLLPAVLLRALGLVAGLTAALMVLALIGLATDRGPGSSPLDWVHSLVPAGGLRSLIEHPVLRAACAPFEPWARAVAAESTAEFLPWALASAALYALVSEAAARLPIDFRELSLETASDVAERIRRARRGGGATAGRVTAAAALTRVPWIFGRSPLGGVAWLKSCSMLRKARGTLVFSLLFVAVLLFIARGFADDGEPEHALLASSAMIATLGVLYLSSGLRFDLREDVDRMDVIKAWPLAPWKIFAGAIAPQSALVSALVLLAIGLNAWIQGGFHPAVLALVLVVPALSAAWIAIDNLVFLWAPVRMVPGQEGVLQNAARGLLLMLLRMAFLLVLAALTAVAGGAPYFVLAELLGAPVELAAAGGACVAAVVLAALIAALVALGGFLLGRFDVARERV